MAKAIWNEVVIAESDNTVMVEGNHYFPPDSIKREYFDASNHRTVCPWKGVANYYSIRVNGEVNESAAWTYANPKEAASHIKNHVAFWKGVRIES